MEKNYDKSFDHRSFYFKQQDKRSYTIRNLVADIKGNSTSTNGKIVSCVSLDSMC